MDQSLKRTLIRVGAAIVAAAIILWLMKLVETVTIIVLISFFFAYLLDPLVDRLASWRIPRSVAAFSVLMAALLFVVLIIVIIVPSIFTEVTKFAGGAPKYFEALSGYVAFILEKLDITLPETWDQAWAFISEKGRPYASKVFGVADPAKKVFTTIFESTMSLIGALVYLILVPVLIYYLLVSYDEIRTGIVDLIPPYTREPVLRKMKQMDEIIAGFIRGQFTVCLILAFLYSVGFTLIGIDLAVVLGIVSGLLWIIPYVGTLIALVGGVIMALVKFGDILHPAYVVLLITVTQLLEGYILTPRIVGGVIGLHPVVYIIALIVGAKLYGLIGMLTAIPATAMLKVLLEDAVTMYKESQLYQDGKGEGERA